MYKPEKMYNVNYIQELSRIYHGGIIEENDSKNEQYEDRIWTPDTEIGYETANF